MLGLQVRGASITSMQFKCLVRISLCYLFAIVFSFALIDYASFVRVNNPIEYGYHPPVSKPVFDSSCRLGFMAVSIGNCCRIMQTVFLMQCKISGI